MGPVIDVVQQRVALGAPPWPTIDPFLFCVHHDDAYPVANGDFGPCGGLSGRQLGQDFSGADGWSMYHGLVVPGFPQHPHRGFETFTYVRQGLVDHADSMGAVARYGRGDVQWMTAGGGVVHAEMFPLLDDEAPNPTELFQIWINLPAADKLVPAHFSMSWDSEIPRVPVATGDGEVTVLAGVHGDVTAPPPPPHSWAASARSDLAVWHVRLGADATTTLPATSDPDVVRTLYVFAGDGVDVAGEPATPATALVVRSDVDLDVRGLGSGGEVLVLQGRPIGEPVAKYGPFVMNSEDEIRQAFADYRDTAFGGWPWERDDPVHGPDPARFARHADGRHEPAVV